MQFIAFDLESTDGCFGSGNICEFGYCVADENFNITEQDNILIKPTGEVNNAYYRVKLSYPLKAYYMAPTFEKNYAKIGTILKKDDCIVLGHAIHNDIVGINAACKLNNLRPFDFCFVDTQLLYSVFKNMQGVTSLDKIAEDIGADFKHHRADEDARLALLTLKHIMQKEGLAFDELLAAYEANVGINQNGVIENFVSKKCLSQAPSVTSKNSKRRILSMFEPEPVCEADIDTKNELYGKKIFINRDTMIEDIDLTRAVINKLAKLGAKPVGFVKNCDYYVGDADKIQLTSAKVLSMSEFVAMCGDLQIKHYDDKAILQCYAEQKEQNRKQQRLQKFKETKNK